MRQPSSVRRWISVFTAIAAIASIQHADAKDAPPPPPASPQSLVFAVYDGEDAAEEAYDAMKYSEKRGVIHVDAFAVVSKDRTGHVHIKSTQKRSARTGAIVGALVGVLGGLAGVEVDAVAGIGLGYLTGDAVGIPRETINEIKTSLAPGTSGIVAVIDERWVADLESSLRAAQAKHVLDSKLKAPSGNQAPAGTGTSQALAQ
jgi:uncharacterized membrane protein